MLQVILVLSVILLVVYSEKYPSCGECWCIPEDNGSGDCPDWQPQTTFTDQVINTFSNQQPLSIFSLFCNPYIDANCSTSPMQEYINLEGAVCGHLFPEFSNGTKSCSSFTMNSYASKEDALSAGATITHEGSCGLCSTAVDLAIYLSKRSKLVRHKPFFKI